jgi:hypothetical protein
MIAVSLAVGPLQAAEAEDSSTAPAGAPTLDDDVRANSSGEARRQALVDAHGAEIADAILGGTVLQEMTMEQVMLARGEPLRTEVIPPDSALWTYAEGEVAFANGRVSYVDLQRPVAADTAVGQPGSSSAPTPPDEPPVTNGSAARETARVNTPGDGFLALRSEPSIRRGARLLKIPHGTLLTLDECITREDDGRWCRTAFRGEVGWVSDRYLVR